MMYLWLKAFHVIAMVAWFAGLFYLPRLFVYHADAHDTLSLERFKVMEWRLYYAIMWPAACATTLLGLGLIALNPAYYLHAPWMHAKLSLVVLLWIYHLRTGFYLHQFCRGSQRASSKFYRYWNEVPTLLLILIVLLVVVKF
jgi:putative membrane protein